MKDLSNFNAEFSLKANTIETGDKKRGEHMMKRLEPEKSPNIILSANSNMIYSILLGQANEQIKMNKLNLGETINCKF